MGGPLDVSSNPQLSLPPIITLPPLSTSNDGQSPLSSSSYTPSTAQILSAAVHAAAPDYFGETWEDPHKPQRERLQIQTQSSRQLDELEIPQSSLSVSAAQRQSPGEAQSHSRTRSGQSSGERNKSKDRGLKQPSQKAMLSKALQKANTAVLLDNAQNFDGAMQAYTEACNLLSQVMSRSSGAEDKRKLEAIRNTYTSRIKELEKIAPHLMDHEKELPARPATNNEPYKGDAPISSRSTSSDSAIARTATAARKSHDNLWDSGRGPRQGPPTVVPERRESLMPASKYQKLPPQNVFEHYREQRYTSKSPARDTVLEAPTLAPPTLKEMPPSSATRRSPRDDVRLPIASMQEEPLHQPHPTQTNPPAHSRAPSQESMSWLDTIDESGGSAASSVHSRTSSLRVRRKHVRVASGDTEAEFDAALDAAVEAAYDEGFVPEEPHIVQQSDAYDDDVMINARRKVELAKQRIRDTERETAIQLARDRERIRLLQQKRDPRQGYNDEGNESEEEERMLEEMTKGYAMDDFEFGLQSKSALPRESDSSGFSGKTWNGSVSSNAATSGTSLSTVTEKPTASELATLMSSTPPPVYPPPSQALPPPPPGAAVKANTSGTLAPGVRNRRLSGQNAKQLKIETVTRASTPPSLPPSGPPPRAPGMAGPQTAGAVPYSRVMVPPSIRPSGPPAMRQASSPLPGPSFPEVVTPPTPTLIQSFNSEEENARPPSNSGSPNRGYSGTGLKKNFSSSSLRNYKSRNLSVSAYDDGSELSPNTPMSTTFSVSPASAAPNQRLPATPGSQIAGSQVFQERDAGISLFSADLRDPNSPGSSDMSGKGGPIPLEPCPREFLLRPFWLMRALYQTIAHPRGGYISTKLFVPRDVWRVKGVKLKGVEDKIASCDYLTAALQKLSKVNTYDADAVLEEMQALEVVLDQVRATLVKKLGSEVGVQGSGMLFKDASAGDVEASARTPSTNKSSFSWRRLRNKSSGVGLSNAYAGKATAPGDVSKDHVTMATVPMTTNAVVRFAKRDISAANFSGPNGNYMAALARLFDAVQVVGESMSLRCMCAIS